MTTPSRPTGLRRELGVVALASTGICSMVGAGINIVPFALQRTVPGIGDWVLVAYALAAVPAVLAALCYAMLGSAMPRAGGSYVYASRAIGPYAGFLASFSQWFGLCIAIGVVSYVAPAATLRCVMALLGGDRRLAGSSICPARCSASIKLRQTMSRGWPLGCTHRHAAHTLTESCRRLSAGCCAMSSRRNTTSGSRI